jgi:hypothetical protein
MPDPITINIINIIIASSPEEARRRAPIMGATFIDIIRDNRVLLFTAQKDPPVRNWRVSSDKPFQQGLSEATPVLRDALRFAKRS